YTRAHLQAWLTPMAVWGSFLFVIGVMMLCLLPGPAAGGYPGRVLAAALGGRGVGGIGAGGGGGYGGRGFRMGGRNLFSPGGQASLASYSSRSLFQQLAGGMSGGRPGNYSEIGITGL